jgi:amino acid adenylation domain-containing protein
LLIQVEQHFGHDGWSLANLLREIGALYSAFVAGEPSPLSELPIQFKDYAVWERNQLQGAILEHLLSYWRSKLDNSPPPPELPTDYPRPKVRTFQGATLTQFLPSELAEAIRGLSRRENVTLFVTMFIGFQILLHRHTGQTDLIIGTAVANRTRPETEAVIGMLANTLPLRSDLAGDPTFRELLKRIREVVREALEYQALPFEAIVEDLYHNRDNSRNPLFDIMFSFHDAPMPSLRWPGVTGKIEYRYNGSAKFDLDITVIPDFDFGYGGQAVERRPILVEWEYSSDLFAEATIAGLMREYELLLYAAIGQPDLRISEIPLLDATAEQHLLEACQGPPATFPLHLCFAEQFETQVERTPHAIAASSGEVALTYCALNARANVLARALVDRGVCAGVVVALLAHRDLEFLTAVIAVLKAGGAYLPLDPSHSLERLCHIVDLSGVRMILAAQTFGNGLKPKIERSIPGRRIDVLSLQQLLSGIVTRNLPPRCKPADLAYVIYTSGSTGEPKGAMIEQRGMLNHLYAKIGDLRLGHGDIVAQTASQCFDISIWQMFAALLVGAQVRILADEVTRDPRGLIAEVDCANLSVIELVPSMLGAVLDEVNRLGGLRPRLGSLRWLIVTGEALSPALCRRWFGSWPGIPIMNAYGPTECSDDVTHHVIDVPPAETAVRVAIGRPLSNVRIYIVDRNLRPRPLGVVGELCVGGICVGRGYINDGGRTGEVFVPDPFCGSPGARMYRTGDLARRLADGSIEYLGRLDFQVKLRGFRIELGEIEAGLLAYPGVRQAVVVLEGDAADVKRLVAYVVADDALSVAKLKSHLWKQLPEYMLPACIVVLPALPLTPNGKIDRRMLPSADGFSAPPEAESDDPRNPIEVAVAAVWRAHLRLGQIPIHRNFFELGGHSLMAIQILVQLQDQFQVDLNLPAFFEKPTIASFAAHITARLDEAAGTTSGVGYPI